MEQQVLKEIGLEKVSGVHYNLPVSKLVEAIIINHQGVLTDCGALACDTGRFTGRSPKDKYIVADGYTKNTIGGATLTIHSPKMPLKASMKKCAAI